MRVTKAMKLALARVAETQQAFWDALSDFESETGVDLLSGHDYIDYTDPTDADVREVLKAGRDGGE